MTSCRWHFPCFFQPILLKLLFNLVIGIFWSSQSHLLFALNLRTFQIRPSKLRCISLFCCNSKHLWAYGNGWSAQRSFSKKVSLYLCIWWGSSFWRVSFWLFLVSRGSWWKLKSRCWDFEGLCTDFGDRDALSGLWDGSLTSFDRVFGLKFIDRRRSTNLVIIFVFVYERRGRNDHDWLIWANYLLKFLSTVASN